jgi:hypothetical protein
MIYDAEMQWLEAKQGAKDSAFVSTTFDLENGETEKTVQFEQAFPKGSEIQVVGWVQSFRFGTEEGKDYACDFWATKVTPKGFTAHAECGENTERLTVTYIALKKGKDKVATGSFSTGNDGEEGENAQEIKGKVSFEEGAFEKAPTVLVALSQFELAGGKDLRVGVEVEHVSESGFSWVIRKWHRPVLYMMSTDIDQVHGVMMQRAHCKVRRLLILPLDTKREPFILQSNLYFSVLMKHRKIIHYQYSCTLQLQLSTTVSTNFHLLLHVKVSSLSDHGNRSPPTCYGITSPLRPHTDDQPSRSFGPLSLLCCWLRIAFFVLSCRQGIQTMRFRKTKDLYKHNGFIGFKVGKIHNADCWSACMWFPLTKIKGILRTPT